MESEGPQTLRGKKRETAAEQMSRQQQEFENHVSPARDEAQAAATHNETHPKLKRQLDKRRSATEFLDRPAKRMRLSQPEPRRGKPGRRPRRSPGRPRRPRTRVAKRRDQRPCACSKCLRKPRQNMARIYVYVANKRIGTDWCLMDAKAPAAVPGSLQGSNHSVGVHTPVSRNQSLSSYNSFYSADHQPMV